MVRGRAVSAARVGDAGPGFRVVLADGSAVLARRLLLATGLTDGLPELPGFAQRWGREVLHCPYCHGWEVRDQAIGVLSDGPAAVHQALLWRQWSADVTLFRHTGPEPDAEQYEQLAARGIAVVDGEVTGLEPNPAESGGKRLAGVALADGRVVRCQALVVFPRFAARTDLLADLGLASAEQEMNGMSLGSSVGSDPMGATGVPGVWTAGNVTALMETVVGAAASGVRAAGAINADLVAEDTREAVAAQRLAATVAAAPVRADDTPHRAGNGTKNDDTPEADAATADTPSTGTAKERTRR